MSRGVFTLVRQASLVAALCVASSTLVAQPPTTSGNPLKYDANGNVTPSAVNGHVLNLPSGTTLNGVAIATGGTGLSDGDKGDVTVSGTGATFAVDSGAVAFSELASKPTTVSGFAITDVAPTALVRHKDGTSTVYQTTANTNAARGTALTNAVAAAVAYDEIEVSGGIFDIGSGSLTLPANARLNGAGMDVTNIQSTRELVGSGTIVVPGTDSVISNLTVTGTGVGVSQGPIGSWSTYSQSDFTGATLINVKTVAEADGIYMRPASASDLRAFNCVFLSKYDCVTVFGGGTAEAHNSVAISTGPSTISLARARALVSNGGTIRWYGGTLTASGTSDAAQYNTAAAAVSAGGVVEVHNARLSTTAGAAPAYDLYQTAGTVSVSNVTRVDGAAITSSGSITQLSRSASRDLNLSDLADAETARLNLGLEIGEDVQEHDPQLDTWAGITPAANVGTFLGAPSSANLLAALTTKTGTGNAVFSADPTFTGTVTIPFTQAGTGATARTVDAKLKDGWVSVKDFGALADGTNDTPRIQAAIDAVKATSPLGGTVYFPPGIYRLSTALTIDTATNITFQGSGFNATELLVTDAVNVFTVTGVCSRLAWRDMWVGSATARASGTAFSFTGTDAVHSDDFELTDIKVQNMPVALDARYIDSTKVNKFQVVQSIGNATVGIGTHLAAVRLRDCKAWRINNSGINVFAAAVPSADDVLPGDGWLIDHDCDTIEMIGCGVQGGASGQKGEGAGFAFRKSVDGTSITGPRLVKLFGCYAEYNLNNYLVESGYDVRIIAPHGAVTTADNCSITGGDSVAITEPFFILGGTNGISITSTATSVSVLGGVVSNNSQAADNTSDGIVIGANTVGVQIIGVKSGNFAPYAAANDQRYGLNINATGTDYITATGNRFEGNDTAGLNNLSAGANNIVLDYSTLTSLRTGLGLAIGTNVQAYDADLTTWAGITPGTGAGTALAINVGSAGAFLANNGSGAALTGIYLPGGTDVALADGGTGSSTASGARTNLQISDAGNVKVYRALLTQVGTSAPTAVIMENSLGGTVVWARASQGVYTATLASAFTANKTWMTLGLPAADVASWLSGYEIGYLTSTSVITLRIGDPANAGYTDDALFDAPIEIRVYP